MRNIPITILIFGVLLCCGGLARAELITIAISGQVTSVSDQYNHFGGQIHVDAPITGTYTYDTSALDSNPSLTLGDYEYNASSVGIWLTVEGFDFKTNPSQVSFHIGVYEDSLGIEDQLVIGSHHNMPLPDDALVQHIIWQLNDSTATALSSDSLPLTAPDLTKWNSNVLNISTDRNFGITATITSAVLIPEPCSLLLLTAGLALIKRQQIR
jgi:hypothetical protein